MNADLIPEPAVAQISQSAAMTKEVVKHTPLPPELAYITGQYLQSAREASNEKRKQVDKVFAKKRRNNTTP